jgi:Zn-dependent peptidase ImmA (M78 family)/DNA-binding XRE family transcriptional regulator
MLFNPERLALARRRRGLSKLQLAVASGVSDRSLIAYENGETVPLAETLRQIAKALAFPVEFFSRGYLDDLPTEGVSFRSLSKRTAAQRDRALAGGRMALELNDWIERRFDLSAPALPDLRGTRKAEAAAMSLRAHWALGDKPISHMVRVLEHHGVRVFSLAEDCVEVDAFSFWRGSQAFVFLNTLKSSERSRFDAAHELAHLVLHKHGQPAGRQAEREADAFASAFLMPRSSILAYAPRLATIKALIKAKKYWNVALSALAHRMHACGLLTDWVYRGLCVELNELGYRTQEPGSAPREMSQALEKVFAHLRQEGVTKADVATELGWPLAELEALVFGLILSSQNGGSRLATKSANKQGQLRLMDQGTEDARDAL